MPKMSFVIPIYNAQDSIEKCINSILNQTDDDFEIICINDGSVDKSLDILNNIAKQEKRITIVSQNNQGASYSRNKGIKIAKGEYIAFVDSDDYIETNFLKTTYDFAVKNSADCVHINNYLHWQNGSVSSVDTLAEYKKLGDCEKLEYNLPINFKKFKNILMMYDQAPWRRIYKKDFLILNNIFFPERVKPQGEDFSFSLAVKINTDIFFIKDLLYHHVIRDNSISHDKNLKFPLYEIIQACNIVRDNYSDKNNELNEPFDSGIISYCLYANYINSSNNDYIAHIKDCLSETQYLKFLKTILKNEIKAEVKEEILKEIKITPKKIINNIFSVVNEYSNNKKYKVIKLFGIKAKIKLPQTLIGVERERERERE